MLLYELASFPINYSYAFFGINADSVQPRLGNPLCSVYCNYLRRVMLILYFPFSSWLIGIDGRPGFNSQVLDFLKNKMESEERWQYQDCCLMIDGMKIKKMVEYDPTLANFTGFVDLGEHFQAEGQHKATEALVFMIVGLRGHWKQAIAYFLIRGISGTLQSQLVIHAISMLADIGVTVRALIMDGHPTNMSTIRKLGCSTTAGQFQSYFVGPSDQKVYCFIDACHSMKLVRNVFATVDGIVIPTSGTAKWSHIKKLNEIQKKEGLAAANKLTDRHIHFEQQKMRVSCSRY